MPRTAGSAGPAGGRRSAYDACMDLEERTLETVGERCEECGATLTESELKQAMEAGGPALCTVHAAEVASLDADVLDEPAP